VLCAVLCVHSSIYRVTALPKVSKNENSFIHINLSTLNPTLNSVAADAMHPIECYDVETASLGDAWTENDLHAANQRGLPIIPRHAAAEHGATSIDTAAQEQAAVHTV
jgi:hypothetical protein